MFPGVAASGSAFTQVLGGAALRVEHIGSTSVPGLAAKPIVAKGPLIESIPAAAPDRT